MTYYLPYRNDGVNYLLKMEVEQPTGYSMGKNCDCYECKIYDSAYREYQHALEAAKQSPILFMGELPGKDRLIEGEDFELQYQTKYFSAANWEGCFKREYDNTKNEKRIVAIPMTQEKKENMKQNIYFEDRVYIGVDHYVGTIEDLGKYLHPFRSLSYIGRLLKDGQVVTEGIDYRLQHQLWYDESWNDCTEDQYNEHEREGFKLIRAVSLNEQKTEVTSAKKEPTEEKETAEDIAKRLFW